MAPLYFPKLIQINNDLMLKTKRLICAKFDADLINMSKVKSRKTKWPRFLAYPIHAPGPVFKTTERTQWCHGTQNV